MKVLGAYFSRHWKLLVLLGGCLGICSAVFYLYGLPLESVGYAFVLCFALGLALFAAGYFQFLRRHRELKGLLVQIREKVLPLPPPKGLLEEDYQALLRALSSERAALALEDRNRIQDMTDYYTLWAHQIKTPIAAMRLLLQEEPRPELEGELLKIEQYVEMVLGYLRLGSDSTDYVFRDCDLDSLIRQSVRKYARLFILKKISLYFQATGKTVLTDGKWLSFVIEQLLSNAVKYTPEGGGVRIYGDGETLVIADSGRKADAERSGEFIREYLRAGAAECEILYLDELLKDSYEEEMYRREKDRKNIDAGRNGMKEWQGTKEENQKKGILIFKSRSLCYASTDYFAERLAEAFEKSGYRADILDFDNEGDIRLEEALKREYSALFDFNSDLPKAYMEDGRHYLDCFHAPFFQILLDHPMYFHASLKENLKEEYVCCIDEGHAEYVKRYYPNVKGAFCMPIPGIPAGDLEKLPSLEERKMDIFLPATYENPEKYEQEIGQAIPDIQEGIWDIINQMKKTPELSMEKALENMLVSQEMDCLDRKGKATIFHAHFLADMYINAYYREKAVKELLKSGIKIHACGQGWERFVCEGRENLTVIPAVDFKEISGLMKQAKIVLNIAYAFKNGCHDRVLSTMLAGAVSVTSKSPYMEMHFSEEDLVFYRMGELEKLPELLRETARNINGLKRIAQNGYRKAAEEYTWEKRVQEFMDLVDRQHE